MEWYPTFNGSRPWPWPWIGSSHTAYHHEMHHSSTSNYMPTFTEIEETVCGRMDRRMDGHMDVWTDGDLRPILLGRLSKFDVEKRVSKLIWQKTASPSCQPCLLQMWPFLWGDLDPSDNVSGSWAPDKSVPKLHLDHFSQFWTGYPPDQHTLPHRQQYVWHV